MTNISYPGVSYWSWSSNPANGAVGGVYMENNAGQSMVALLSAYHAATGGYLEVNEGYRSFAGQQYWQANGSGGTPGLSLHGWGQAFDVTNFTVAQHNWVKANCGQFNYAKLGSGVYGEFDYTHYNYTGASGGPSQEHTDASSPNSGDEDMKVVRNSTGNTYIVGSEYIHHLPDQNYINSATKLHGAVVVLDDVAWHCYTDAMGIPWATIPTVGPGAGWSFGRGLFRYPW